MEPPAASILDLAEAEALTPLMSVGCRNLAVAQDLDRVAVTHGTLGDQIGNGDFATLWEQFRESSNVDDLILLLERALEATQLRKAHVQRQLATFEARTNLVTLLGALVATARGLTLGAFTTADAECDPSWRPEPASGHASAEYLP